MLLAAVALLSLAGLGSLGFGLYAILRGGRDRRGGIGPIPERAVHVLAGARMLLVGALCLSAAAFALFIHFG